MSNKILITGATGFIGSHLAELCVEKGFSVVAFDRYNSNNNWGWLENSKYKNEMEIILGDVRDYDSVSKAIKGCNTVFHLAALPSVPQSITDPIKTAEVNMFGTLKVLEHSRNAGVKKVVFSSSCAIYGDNSKAQEILGWKYNLSFFDILESLIKEEERNYI